MSASPALGASVALAHPRSLNLLSGFLSAFLLTAGSLAAAALLWGQRGGELVVVGLGWPHVILGFMFYANKIIKQAGPERTAFYWLFAITVGISLVHTWTPITTLIYIYFVFHAFRDEIFMYHHRRTGHKFAGKVFDRGGLALLGGVVLLAGLGQLHTLVELPWEPAFFRTYTYGDELVLTGLVMAFALWAVWDPGGRIAQRIPGMGYALPALFLAMAAMCGMKVARFYGYAAPLFFSFLVVFHYWSWYVFYLEKMAARSPAPRPAAPAAAPVERSEPTILDRVLRAMSTPRGFVQGVVLMNVVSFGAAYLYQVQQLDFGLRYLFDLDFFLYALVFHVTVSFAPKPRGGPKPGISAARA